MITVRRLAAGTGVAVLAALVALAPPPRAGRADPGTPSLDPRPVRMVILVDESGSLEEEGVAAEREAASILAQSEFSEDSTVAVLGFASAKGDGQRPTDPACELAPLKTARANLSTCVSTLRIRTREQGYGTDFVSAYGQALSLMAQPGTEETKIIFMLTDGKLDLSESSGYESLSEDQRAREGHRLLGEKLKEANAGRVQVWPLGFGRDISTGDLDEMAAGGYQGSCDNGAHRPKARTVGNASDVTASLLEAFASARCASFGAGESGSVASGAGLDLHVTVPSLATDGAIAVTKRDPRLVVTYYDPSGAAVPKSGDRGEATYSVTGESGPVEVLRIRNPAPGNWRVHVQSSSGVPSENVSATVLWQGRIQASIIADTPSPEPGAPDVVRIHLVTRTERLTDPGALKGVRVIARLTGAGFSPIDVDANDDGRAPDRTAHDGEYAAQFTIPSTATGNLEFVGLVSGAGLDPVQLPAKGAVQRGLPPVQVAFGQPSGLVPPGGGLKSQMVLTNNSGGTPRVRLVLGQFDPGTVATVRPGVVDLANAGARTVPFTVQVDPSSRQGPAQAVLSVVDDADPTKVYGNLTFAFTIGYPPPWWQRYQWVWYLLSALALAAAAVAVQRARRARADRDVQGLVLVLSRGGATLNELVSPTGGAVFRFTVRDPEGPRARLDIPMGTDRAFDARRLPDGTIGVDGPTGRVVLRAGQPEELLPGIRLTFRDLRHSDPVPSGARGAAPQPPRPAGEFGPRADDDLL